MLSREDSDGHEYDPKNSNKEMGNRSPGYVHILAFAF